MKSVAATGNASIELFQIDIPDPGLEELELRLEAHALAGRASRQWLGLRRPAVAHARPGRVLADRLRLARGEARLNAHRSSRRRSTASASTSCTSARRPDALPLLVTHGWPGSVAEFLDVIGPLTDPAE